MRSLGVIAGLAAAPVVLKAPPAVPAQPGEPTTLDEVVGRCRDSRLAGWDLVGLAQQLVHDRYTHYSAWHLWQSPQQSFANGRGLSNQYNSALAQVLEELGFEVRRVHAARVRLERAPWWHSGHTWLKVTHEGRTRDVCASRPSTAPGRVAFVPVTPVRPFTGLTNLNTTLGLAPFVIEAVWRSLLTREPTPRWLYRRFGEPVTTGSLP
nr:hypothetical protein [Aestuariimicrobium ganziense]